MCPRNYFTHYSVKFKILTNQIQFDHQLKVVSYARYQYLLVFVPVCAHFNLLKLTESIYLSLKATMVL